MKKRTQSYVAMKKGNQGKTIRITSKEPTLEATQKPTRPTTAVKRGPLFKTFFTKLNLRSKDSTPRKTNTTTAATSTKKFFNQDNLNLTGVLKTNKMGINPQGVRILRHRTSEKADTKQENPAFKLPDKSQTTPKREEEKCFLNKTFAKLTPKTLEPTQNTFFDASNSLIEIKSGNIDDYLIGQEIGKGAYAVVKTAIHKPTNQKVALKIYDKFKLLEPNRKKSVQREIQILSRISHPHIMKLHESIDTTKHLYLVMEYIRGFSLHSYLKSKPNRRLSETEAKVVFRQLMDAINYCHRHNITHRDIKLENILLDQDKRVKLIDFGFSTCFPHEKKVRMFCGTPSYMAPEIVSKKEFSGAPADIWACGVLLYVMVCGAFPFRDTSEKEKDLYDKICKGLFAMPSNISSQAKDLITELLCMNPEKRPSAKQVLQSQWMTEKGYAKATASFLNTTHRLQRHQNKYSTRLYKKDTNKFFSNSGRNFQEEAKH